VTRFLIKRETVAEIAPVLSSKASECVSCRLAAL